MNVHIDIYTKPVLRDLHLILVELKCSRREKQFCDEAVISKIYITPLIYHYCTKNEVFPQGFFQ